MTEYSEGFSVGWSSLLKSYTWDRVHEKGPNACMIKISSTSNVEKKHTLAPYSLILYAGPPIF